MVSIVRNDNFKVRDGFETINNDLWTLQQGQGDIVELAGNTQGSGYLKISKSIFDEDQETVLLSNFIVDSPVRFAIGMSISQRLFGQRFQWGLVGVDADGNVASEVPVNNPVAISSISQATTTLTVTTATPHGFVPNDRIQVYGVADSRLNHGEVLVATITSPTVFTVTNNPSGAIVSQTTSATSGFVQKVDPFLYANNALGVVWEGNSASNAKMLSRSGKSAIFNGVDTSMGTNHTNGTQANTNNFADAWNPTYMMDVRYKAESVIARTMPMDSTGAIGNTIKRSQVIPEISTGYKIRIRARNNKALSKPIGRIITSVKAGTSVATITMDQPHGLTTGDFVTIFGNRDQVSFANQSGQAQVASVVNATTFTVTYGAGATATTRGGTVVKVNGSQYTYTALGQAVQTIACSGGWLTVTGNANWSGILPGETVELYGLVDNSSGVVYNQYEGGYKVLSVSTTSLILAAPNTQDFAALTVGGAVFKRTDFRLHLFRAIDYNRQTVEVDGSVGNIYDNQEALGVNVINFSTNMNGQSSAHDAAINGNPLRIGARAVTANYTAVQTGDVADLVATLVGAIIQKPYSIPENDWSYASAAAYTATTDVVLKAAAGAGLRNYVTAFQVMNTGTVATEFVIKDGTTVIYRGFLPANMAGDHDFVFPTPLKTTANAVLNFAAITTGANIYVNAQGYVAP